MPLYRVRRTTTKTDEMWVRADDWEEAEEHAKYAPEDEWIPSNYEIEPDYDVDEEEE